MPHLDIWETKGLHRKYHGVINPDEILQANLELNSDPRFSEITYIINDFTEISGISISENHTKIFALTDDIISATKGKLKIAIVVIKNEYVELANTYRNELKNHVYHCEIFQTINKAREWVATL